MMTKRELLDLLKDYPDETPIFDARGFDLHSYHIARKTYDDWEHSTKTDDGEIPAIGVGIAIGR